MRKKAMMINVGYRVRSRDAIGHILNSISGNVRMEYTSSGDVSAACDFDLSEFEVYIISELSPQPWAQLAMISVLCETLRSRQVNRITLIVPLWRLTGMREPDSVGYRRVDSSKTITRMLDGCGIDRIVTLTPSSVLRSPLFPIEVVRPDFEDLMKCMLPNKCDGIPLMVVESPEMHMSARSLASEMTMNLAVNQYSDQCARISADVRDRDVMIYSEKLDGSRILRLENEVLSRGAASCAIFAPIMDMTDGCVEQLLAKVKTRIYTFDDVLNGRDTGNKLNVLPVDRIIANWIEEDIQKRDLLVQPGEYPR